MVRSDFVFFSTLMGGGCVSLAALKNAKTQWGLGFDNEEFKKNQGRLFYGKQ